MNGRVTNLTSYKTNLTVGKTYALNITWNPRAGSKVITIALEGKSIISSNDKSINTPGYSGFATGPGTNITTWFDDFRINNNSGFTPVAAYTQNSTQCYGKPCTIAFTDTSRNSPTSWYWVFGDGETSISQNPTHTFTEYGLYPVTLTASNWGGSDTTVLNNTRATGVIDPAGWEDHFSTDSSSKYGIENSRFIWDTKEGVLNSTQTYLKRGA